MDAAGWDVTVPEDRAEALGLLVEPREAAEITVQTQEGPRYVNTLDCLDPTSSTGDYVLRVSKPFGTDVALQLLAIRTEATKRAKAQVQELELLVNSLRERASAAEAQLREHQRTFEGVISAHNALGERCEELQEETVRLRAQLLMASHTPLGGVRHAAVKLLLGLAKRLDG